MNRALDDRVAVMDGIPKMRMKNVPTGADKVTFIWFLLPVSWWAQIPGTTVGVTLSALQPRVSPA